MSPRPRHAVRDVAAVAVAVVRLRRAHVAASKDHAGVGTPRAEIEASTGAHAVSHWAPRENVFKAIDFCLRPESGTVTGFVFSLGGIG